MRDDFHDGKIQSHQQGDDVGAGFLRLTKVDREVAQQMTKGAGDALKTIDKRSRKRTSGR